MGGGSDPGTDPTNRNCCAMASQMDPSTAGRKFQSGSGLKIQIPSAARREREDSASETNNDHEDDFAF